jgi:ATP-dependent protease HslVU (ClpYQ) peptidase subunit
MSVVIGIKQGETVHIGSDSQTTSGDVKISRAAGSDHKIIRLKGIENTLIAFVGRSKLSDAVRASDRLITDDDLVNGEVTYGFVVGKLVDRLRALEIEHGIIDKDDVPYKPQYEAMVAHRDKLFVIESTDSGLVFEIEGYCTIGSGSYDAGGALAGSEGADPEDRILDAIKAAKKGDRFVDFPVVIKNTSDTSTLIIKEQVSYRTLKGVM